MLSPLATGGTSGEGARARGMGTSHPLLVSDGAYRLVAS